MENLKIIYDNKEYVYSEGTTLLDISKDFCDRYKERIIVGEINGRLCELNTQITNNSRIDFFDLTTSIGNKVYESGIIFLLSVAFYNVFKCDIEVKYSIDKGIYIKTFKRINEESLKKVEKEMNSIIEKDLPIEKILVSRIDAIDYYKKLERYDKVNILKYSVNTNVNLYRIQNLYDYYFSYLPISTGYIKDFKLTLIDGHSFVLRYPNIYTKTKIPKYIHHDKLFNEFKKYDSWCERLNINNVSSLNKIVSNGKIEDIILLSEKMQNNEMYEISKDIKTNKNVKIILMAGPSSSGKTTSSKKLELYLKGFGYNPVAISMDDYFIEREKTPRLEDGSYDFESVNAIDISLFNKDLQKLLEGQSVKIPTYNFITGKREYINDSLKLKENDIIIIEGLHALNEKLTYSIPREKKYKIYLCPLTVLNLDNHNRIKTTDNRLLRRIIRDSRTRGYSAEDTLLSWDKVRIGEEKHVFPFQDEADAILNTSLVYELGVLKTYAEPLLFSVDEDSDVYKEAIRLLNLLKNILPIPDNFIPRDSILREFIGDSYFNV